MKFIFKLSKAPQNNKKFFLIDKGDWGYAVDIKFAHLEPVNMVNLFCILKSYVIKNEHAVRHVLSMSQLDKDDKKKICTYSLIPADKLKKVDFIDFVKLYDNIHSRDYEYIALHQFYGFRILFFPESIF